MPIPTTPTLSHGPIEITQCRHGWFMYSRNDLYIGQSLKHYGEWAEAEVQLLNQIIQPHYTILDIGANIGTLTVPMAKQLSQGRVYAFEPERFNFYKLCANINLNNLRNVVCAQKAVGAACRPIQIRHLDDNIKDNFGNFSVTEMEVAAPSLDNIELVTIDSLNIEACHLIKIDVEGMEAAVLQGATKTIARCLPTLFVENNNTEKSQHLIDLLQQMGYRMWWHLAGPHNKNNYQQNQEFVFPSHYIEANMLCVHQSQQASVRGLDPVRGPHDSHREAIERMLREVC